MGKIIFDASVLVTGYTSASHHKTGLFRVSHELLKQLVKSNEYEIYLFDIFFREREVIKYVQSEFTGCSVIKGYSPLYRVLIFPVGNTIDSLRKIQDSSDNFIIRNFSKVLKNLMISFERIARKIERVSSRRMSDCRIFEGCDLYYSTYYPIPELIRNNTSIKKVYTLHDLIPIIHPEFFTGSFNTMLVREVVDNIRNDDFVICVSNSTKRDLIFVRGDLDDSKIFVSHLAASSHFYPEKDKRKLLLVREKYKIPLEQRYILSVCTFEPRKNLKTLIAAYNVLLNEDKDGDVLLVLAGAPYWDKDPLLGEISRINNDYKNKIFITGFVPDEDLPLLYSGAYLFVYPSFYEGFGLPPLEAMKCGIPVICSNTSSLPEVVGDGGILINPESTRELANAIHTLLIDQDLHDTLSVKASSNASSFSWERSSEILFGLFKLAQTL
ncbi:MAG TPA: glycosyltransferase family 1 protein [Bacteroidales bacterium]|nr:glycosyltransferase family 1 protein [Bacteroidales bacterium]